MRAAQYYGKEDLRVEQVEERPVGKGQVKVAPAYCGICGTDLHEWAGGPTFAPLPNKPHPITHEHTPITIGHEFSGTILEIGPEVQGSFKVGDHVCICPSIYCGSCVSCKLGAWNACDSGGFLGLSGWGGGLADRVVVPENMLVKLPEGIGLEIGALVEPLAVGWHAVSASAFREGDRVLVMGGGPIGLAVLQALKARNASLIITAEVSPNRQKFATSFGAHHILNPASPSDADLPARCRELCGGELPDVVFDCAGVPASIKAACQCIRARGQVLNVAIWEKEIPFMPNRLVFKEATYKGVLGYLKEDFEWVVNALAKGMLHPGKMITKKIKLEDLVEQGMRTLVYEKDQQVKILVDLNA